MPRIDDRHARRTIYINPFVYNPSSIREGDNIVPPEDVPSEPQSTPSRDSSNSTEVDFTINGRKGKVALVVVDDVLYIRIHELIPVSDRPAISIGSFFRSLGTSVGDSLVFVRYRRVSNSDFLVCSRGRDGYFRVRELKCEPTNLG